MELNELIVIILMGIAILVPLFIYISNKFSNKKLDDLEEENSKLKILLENVDLVISKRNNKKDEVDVKAVEDIISKRIDKGEFVPLNELLKAANLEYFKCNFDNAKYFYNYLIKLSKEKDNFWILSNAYSNIGYVYFDTGEIELAFEKINNAIEISKKVDDLKLYSEQLANLGILYAESNEYEKALSITQEALELTEKIGYTKGVNFNSIQLVLIKHELNYNLNYDSLINEIYKEFYKQKDAFGLAYCTAVYGVILKDQQRYEEAITNFERALVFWEEVGFYSEIASVLINIGYAYICKHDIENGKKSLLRAKELILNKKLKYSLNQIESVLNTIEENN